MCGGGGEEGGCKGQGRGRGEGGIIYSDIAVLIAGHCLQLIVPNPGSLSPKTLCSFFFSSDEMSL